MRRKKPGPKGLLKNPTPAEEWISDDGRDVSRGTIDEIHRTELDANEHVLRNSFKARRRELTTQPGETAAAATKRIAELVQQVAEENWVELRWTGRRQESVEENPAVRLYRLTREPDGTWTRRYVGPPPERGPWRYRIRPRDQERYDESTRTWKRISRSVVVIEQYDEATESWKLLMKVPDGSDAERWLRDLTSPPDFVLSYSWPGLVSALRDPVRRMLNGTMGRAGKSGRPAYLACALLGALLNRPPDAIRDILDNLHHPRRRPKA